MSKEPIVTNKVHQWMAERESTPLPNAGPQSNQVELSVVIPAFNEQWRIPTTLIDIIDFLDTRSRKYEVLVVDDGSSDQTVAVVNKFKKIRPEVSVISLPQNRGKGGAVRAGVLAAQGDKIIFADADGSTPIKELARLEAALAAGADVAIGSRALYSRDTKVVTHWYRKYPGRFFNFCVNSLILPGLADTQCGFKMFSKAAAKFVFSRQKADGFSFDVEILFIAKQSGLKVAEVPVNWVNVPGSKVNMALDAMKMFRDIFTFRLRHRDITKETFARWLEAHQSPGN